MEKKFYHIDLCQGEVGRYVLLPGDPGRVELIAQRFDHPRLVADHREYKTMTGMLDGVPVSVTSTGIGGPSTAIAVEELHMAGADTFIRVGTCGGMQPQIIPGDIVVATAAIRAEGTSKEYMPIEFPAVPDFSVLSCLAEAARELGNHHIGIVQCKDSFYGQHEAGRMPVRNLLQNNWQAWIEGGCMASEMESAALFVISSVLRCRAGSVHLCLGNIERDKQGLPNPPVDHQEKAINAAILALRKLIRIDQG